MSTVQKRFVVDTNILVSAVIRPRSSAVQCFASIESKGIFLYSDETLQELSDVLLLPKFASYASLPKCATFLSRYTLLGERVVVTETVSICRDPKDDKFLALAVAGQADYLVTGDADLLSLGSFGGTPIIRISDVLALAL